jgi:predicted O-methyltransferase YrrM
MSEIENKNNQVKNYISSLFCPEDEILSFVHSHSKELGLPDIHVPSHVGKLLYFLAKVQNPSRVLEIGTLGGYSTIWLARALSDQAKLISLEKERRYVAFAQEHLKQAGLQDRVDVRQGDALDSLSSLFCNREGTFDLIFIDADKENNLAYLDWAIQLSHPGSLILIDNLIPKGEEIGYPSNDEAVSIYYFNQHLAKHPRLEVTLVPTIVGNQGRLDAIGLARVKE